MAVRNSCVASAPCNFYPRFPERLNLAAWGHLKSLPHPLGSETHRRAQNCQNYRHYRQKNFLAHELLLVSLPNRRYIPERPHPGPKIGLA